MRFNQSSYLLLRMVVFLVWKLAARKQWELRNRTTSRRFKKWTFRARPYQRCAGVTTKNNSYRTISRRAALACQEKKTSPFVYSLRVFLIIISIYKKWQTLLLLQHYVRRNLTVIIVLNFINRTTVFQLNSTFSQRWSSKMKW